jgi:hypothetical protein
LCAALTAAGASVLPAAFLRAAVARFEEQRVTGAELADVLDDDTYEMIIFFKTRPVLHEPHKLAFIACFALMVS